MKTSQLAVSALMVGMSPFVATTQAASLDLDFQATIASQENQSPNAEARYYHVSLNSANPGTGAYRANLPGTNDPAPPFVRNFDGPVIAYRFGGGANDDITRTDLVGGSESSRIVFSSSDVTLNRFNQQQARVWTGNDPGSDLDVSIEDPYTFASGYAGNYGGWRFMTEATVTVDVTGLAAGSVHIYYGDYDETPSLSAVMRDTDGPAPDITIADVHSIADGGNGDAANKCEYYLAEVDFVTDGVYDEVVFVYASGAVDSGRGINAILTTAVADAVDPTLTPADIVDDVGGGPIETVGVPINFSVNYSEFIDPDTVTVDDFEVLTTGTTGGTIESVVHYGGVTTVTYLPNLATDGTLQLQVKAGAVIADLAGNTLDTTSAIADDNIITVTTDTTPPEVASFESPEVSGTIYGTPTLTYTVTFSEPVTTVAAANFTNAGTAPFSIGTVTDLSPGAPEPSVYTVEVIPSGSGTVRLEVQGTIEDQVGNALVVPVTDAKVFTLDTGTEPARETVTLDGSTTSNLTSATHALVFDASASDKLVVVVTGENGNSGDLSGNCDGITYDGVPLIQAVDRAPVNGSPSGPVDQLYNDIWYLDNPAAATALADENDPDLLTTGDIVASVNSRGVITVIRLSNTAPGVGVTGISDQEVKTISLFSATSGGIIIGSLGMGGDGNSADTQNVNTDPLEDELSDVKQGSSWNGHVTAAKAATIGSNTFIFTGGSTTGTHTIAAEFLGNLITAGGTPYADWAALNSVVGGFDGNDDNGSTSNGFEWYYFGTDPQVADGNGSPITGATKTGPNTFEFTHQRPIVRDDVTDDYEWSSNLSSWIANGVADAGITVNLVAVGDGAGPTYETVTVTATVSGGTLDQLFVRQEITNP